MYLGVGLHQDQQNPQQLSALGSDKPTKLECYHQCLFSPLKSLLASSVKPQIQITVKVISCDLFKEEFSHIKSQ